MFTKLSKIQSGSFSTVYRAYDSVSQQDVALKIVEKPSDPDMATKLAKLVAGEYDILMELGNDHPNVCALLDFYERETCYVFVMEFAAHGDLYEVIRRWKTQIESRFQVNIARLVPQLCSAIEYAHSRGIAHRDIKPENVLLDIHGNVKLADWGLSCRERVSQDRRVGTEKYLAPEAYSGLYDTFLADYWSLGITLLFLLFGACPFKSAQLSDNPKNANFAHFVADPKQFMLEYYLKPLHAGRGIVPMSVRTPKGDVTYLDGPTGWLSLPEVGHPVLNRNQLLALLATCIVTNLLVVSPAARSMRSFLIQLSTLLFSSRAYSSPQDIGNEAAMSEPLPSDDVYSKFQSPGPVADAGAEADANAAGSSKMSQQNQKIYSGSVSSGSTNVDSLSSEDSRSPNYNGQLQNAPEFKKTSSEDYLSNELECQTGVRQC
ncbi:LAFA_0A01464g1_1 [Lachancea sp. 'fantastica']|nr:LAFA_0A01464g1_1 [Lachancea sp. 'fantastica']